MTDNEFLAAMNIARYLKEGDDPLSEALRIDDRRSDYCEQLEQRIEEQSRELEELRSILGGYLFNTFDRQKEERR